MSRPDRLFRLLHVLRMLPQPVTATRLAQETEVSERTLYRDIASLRAGGALIDGAPGLGYTLTEDPALPPQTFDRIELEALVVALSDLRHKGDAQLADAADSALAKIAATLPERLQRQILHATHMVHQFGETPVQERDLSVMRTACWEEQAVDIAYADAKGVQTQRRIYPLAIVYTNRGTALLAWCCLRHAFRNFIVARIESFAATDESFRPRRVAMLRDYINQMKRDAQAYVATDPDCSHPEPGISAPQ